LACGTRACSVTHGIDAAQARQWHDVGTEQIGGRYVGETEGPAETETCLSVCVGIRNSSNAFEFYRSAFFANTI